ncbi:MAG: MarR family winged helix-turn-helix transcriptional regulator [Thermoanaerobaculales bacterium]
MPAGNGRADSAGRFEDPSPPSESFHRFLRYGHVLSSLLREFLEEGFLPQVFPHRLPPPQFSFPNLTPPNAAPQVGELARSLGVSAAASSKNLDRLERLGLVSRGSSSEDRRATLITASVEGERLVHDYELLKRARLAPVIDSLGQEKTDQLCDLLEHVCLGLLAKDTAPRATCLRCAGYYRADCSVEQLHGECALRPRRRDRERGERELEA